LAGMWHVTEECTYTVKMPVTIGDRFNTKAYQLSTTILSVGIKSLCDVNNDA